MIPTIEQMMKYYRVIAQTERMKTGRPGEDTVENVLRGTKAVCRAAGIELTENVVVLTRQNIDVKEGRYYLSYTPHKTELSSGRRVYWPIHEDIWKKYEDYGGISCLDVTDETFDEINADLRRLGFHGQKAAYELRKICIDHVYQKYGAEIAVSISGDDIRTISRYYADPAQPNMGAVRIVDLL